MYLQAKILKNIGEGSHTVTVLEKRSSSHHKEIQRDNALEFERKEVQIMSWLYSWVVNIPPIPVI